MPILNIKRHRIIRTLVNDIFTHAELMLRNGAKGYKLFTAQADALELASGDPQEIARLREEAKFHLRHAIQAPFRVKNRVDTLVEKLTLRLGSQANAAAYIDAGITDYMPNATRAEITAHLNSLISIAQTAIDGRELSGWTLPQMADYIESNTDDDDELYAIAEKDFSPPVFTE